MLGRLANTLDKSFDPKRTHEALKNALEAELHLETESSCDSNSHGWKKDVKREESPRFLSGEFVGVGGDSV